MRRFVILVLLFVLVLCSGCSLTVPGYDADDAALEYLREKYDENFELDSVYGGLSPDRKLLVSCESFSDLVFVQVDNYTSLGRTFRDNYLVVKYREDMVSFFDDCVRSVFSDGKVHFKVVFSANAAGLSADASFEEVLRDTEYNSVVMLEIRESDYSSKEQIEEVVELVRASCGRVSLTVIVVPDNIYGTLSREELGRLITKMDFVQYASVMIRNGIADIHWPGWEDTLAG